MDSQNTNSGMGSGMVIGILVVIVLVALFLAYGWPGFYRGGNNGGQPSDTNINIDVPTPDSSNDNGGSQPY